MEVEVIIILIDTEAKMPFPDVLPPRPLATKVVITPTYILPVIMLFSTKSPFLLL